MLSIVSCWGFFHSVKSSYRHTSCKFLKNEVGFNFAHAEKKKIGFVIAFEEKVNFIPLLNLSLLRDI